MLVTGAAGFIGAALARRLLSMGIEVVTVDNLSTGYIQNVPKGVTLIKGDVADPEIYDALKQYRFSAVYHIAGQSSGEVSFDDPVHDLRTNTQSTLLIVKLCRAIRCERLIFASTMSVYGDQNSSPVAETVGCTPKSFYGVGKHASEQYLRIYNGSELATTSLRLFNVYGPGQNMENLRQGMVSIYLAQALKEKKILVKGSKTRFRDFVYIDDVVDCFVSCLNNEASIGQEINIGTGRKTTVEQLLELIKGKFKHEIPVTYKGETSGDIDGIYADITKMKMIFGDSERVSLDEGIGRMYQFYSS